MILQDLEFCFYVAFHLMSQLKKILCCISLNVTIKKKWL